MTNPTPDEQVSELEELAMHRAKIAEETKNLDTLRKEYDEKIAALAGEGTTQAGPYKISVTRARRLDAKKIEAAYPVAQHPEIYKRAVDTDAFKKTVAENNREPYTTLGSPTVRIS
ncbi:hypothetical protein DEO23_14150 [Brachybacterium endophyticum]|uniref:Uncharacterized protein n=1 Tax=Brachybacterium endophyticum TaxID=2182385 RepID=A0A2U2RH90_9MICO|nr:hypothetical protein [Brachybacterium endophyticum]PWH05218.1 hypothetical protein DEO23_14150 [Brachybacterium endophyticum]